MNRQEQQFENDLCALVAKHGWLDGPTWKKVADRVGCGYFEDMPEMVDVNRLAEALKNAPIPTFAA